MDIERAASLRSWEMRRTIKVVVKEKDKSDVESARCHSSRIICSNSNQRARARGITI